MKQTAGEMWWWVFVSTDDWALVLVNDYAKSKWMVLVWMNVQNVELEPW